MKKKIGEIYNIPIIIGDKNLKTKSEIHVDELSNVVGGGAGNAESTMEYLDVSGLDKTSFNFKTLLQCAFQIRALVNNTVAVGAYGLMTSGNTATVIANTTSIAIDFNTPVISTGVLIDNKTLISSLYSEAELAAIPRLTKEEFYNLEA